MASIFIQYAQHHLLLLSSDTIILSTVSYNKLYLASSIELQHHAALLLTLRCLCGYLGHGVGSRSFGGTLNWVLVHHTSKISHPPIRPNLTIQQDGKGTCQKTSSCTTQGFNLAGYCPNDPNGVQCCVKKTCSTKQGSGICLNTSDSCKGAFISGACPGDSSIKVS